MQYGHTEDSPGTSPGNSRAGCPAQPPAQTPERRPHQSCIHEGVVKSRFCMQTLCHLIYSLLSKGEGLLFISGKQKFNNMESTVRLGGGGCFVQMESSFIRTRMCECACLYVRASVCSFCKGGGGFGGGGGKISAEFISKPLGRNAPMT